MNFESMNFEKGNWIFYFNFYVLFFSSRRNTSHMTKTIYVI